MKLADAFPVKPSSTLGTASYADYYKRNLESAIEFQDYVSSLLFDRGLVVVQYGSRKYQFERGENSGGIEIKHDQKLKQTGNLYIECSEKADPARSAYTASGIYRDDNAWLYAIGDYSRVYLFAKSTLQLLHKTNRYTSAVITTSTGFLLPAQPDGERYSAIILTGSEID